MTCPLIRPAAPHLNRRARCAAACLAGCLGLGSAWSADSDLPLELDLPAGPLSDTLFAIARQADTLISFRPELVEGRQAPALRGRLTLSQALAAAAACCRLVLQRTATGALTLVEAEQLPVARPTQPAAAPADPVPPAASLPRVEILGTPRPADGLRPVRAWSGSRTDTPLAELPQSVAVLTAEALALQGGSTVVEALRYVSGATAVLDNAASSGLGAPSLLVRGLQATYALSGLRSVSGDLPIDLAFVERVEVPKGPSAVLGNVVDTRGRGGIVNLVLKEAGPLSERVFTQSVSTRDNGTLRLTSDLGGAWADNANWRLVGVASQSGRTEGGYEQQSSLGAMLSSSVRLGGFTASAMVQASSRRDTPAPASRGGVSPVDGRLTPVPVEPGRQDPFDPDDRTLTDSGTGQVQLRWDISPSWQMLLAGMAEGVSGDLRRQQRFSQEITQSGLAWNVTAQWSLIGKLQSGPVRHTVMLGLDADRWHTSTVSSGLGFLGSDSGLLSDQRTQRKQGLLLQDQMALGPWRLRLAVQRARLPAYEVITSSADRPTNVSEVSQLLATNWDGGLLYQWRPALSVYAGLQYSFEGDVGRLSGLAPDRMMYPAATVHQLQAGLKGQVPGSSLSWTLEAFRIRRQNVLSPGPPRQMPGPPGPPGPPGQMPGIPSPFGPFVPMDGRASDGLELDLAGRVLTRLDISLGLSLSRVIEAVALGDAGSRRVRAAGVPQRQMYLLARHPLPEWLGERSSLDVSLSAASSTLVGFPGFVPSDVRLPGGAQWDVGWERSFGPWNLNLTVRNLLDRQIYGTALDPRYIPLQPGRSVNLSVRFSD